MYWYIYIYFIFFPNRGLNVAVNNFDRSMINAPGPCVLFATPGMISGGFSLEVFKHWAPSEMNLITLPGYPLNLLIKCIPLDGDVSYICYLDHYEDLMSIAIKKISHYIKNTDCSKVCNNVFMIFFLNNRHSHSHLHWTGFEPTSSQYPLGYRAEHRIETVNLKQSEFNPL